MRSVYIFCIKSHRVRPAVKNCILYFFLRKNLNSFCGLFFSEKNLNSFCERIAVTSVLCLFRCELVYGWREERKKISLTIPSPVVIVVARRGNQLSCKYTSWKEEKVSDLLSALNHIDSYLPSLPHFAGVSLISRWNLGTPPHPNGTPPTQNTKLSHFSNSYLACMHHLSNR